jgi:hypothetical protein
MDFSWMSTAERFTHYVCRVLADALTYSMDEPVDLRLVWLAVRRKKAAVLNPNSLRGNYAASIQSHS